MVANTSMESSDLPILQADWPAPACIRALTTLRRGAGLGASMAPFDDFNLGARCGDDPIKVAANRNALIQRLQLPAAPLWLNQVHGTVAYLAAPTDQREPCGSVGRRDASESIKGIAPAGAPTKADGGKFGSVDSKEQPHGSSAPVRITALEGLSASVSRAVFEPVADAAVTTQANTVLAILTADCLPVVFCAEDASEIAAAHAGWRGLAAGVLEATIESMSTSPVQLMAWLGPAAGPLAYEVGEEVRAAFVDADAAAAKAFAATREGHWLCDLPGLARLRLRAAGIRHIYGGQHCTIRDSERFFSHRRDGQSGRMATLIWFEADLDRPRSNR